MASTWSRPPRGCRKPTAKPPVPPPTPIGAPVWACAAVAAKRVTTKAERKRMETPSGPAAPGLVIAKTAGLLARSFLPPSPSRPVGQARPVSAADLLTVLGAAPAAPRHNSEKGGVG